MSARDMPFMMAVQWLRDNYGGYSDDGHGFALCIDMLAEVYGKHSTQVRAAFARVQPTPRIRGIGYVDPVRHDG